jgi:hypothetical protein
MAVVATVFVAVLLLFGGLGGHALWDDEAMDALNAKAILRTGDTMGMVDHNLVAYRSGLLLVEGRQQGMPPLPGYLAAAGIYILGESPLSARFLFASCGVLTITIIMLFAMRLGLSWPELCLVAGAMLGNVSFLLYFRNCHYYGPGIMLTTVCALAYLMLLKSGRGQLLFGLVSALLLLTNYTWFVALYACLTVDCLLNRRDLFKIGVSASFRILIPSFFAGLVILWKWNPLTTKLGGYLHQNSLSQRLELFFWNWRDMNECEFISLGVLIVAAVLAIQMGSVPLRRLLLALLVYVVIITMLSTQLLESAAVADIRYLAGCLPFCIAITSVVLIYVTRKRVLLGVLLALLACGTNVLNGGWLLKQGARSLICEYVSEIFSPAEDPYTPTAAWINSKIPPGASIWVLPDYMTYPLMYHAPRAVYAWQLSPEQRSEEQFKRLPDIHFKGLEVPDYIIVFGPTVIQIRLMLEQWKLQGVAFEEMVRVNTFWKDLYRPELFWRTFKPITGYDLDTQAIYIFKHLKSSVTSTKTKS